MENRRSEKFYLKRVYRDVFRHFVVQLHIVLLFVINPSLACCYSVEFLNEVYPPYSKNHQNMRFVRHDPKGQLFHHDYYAAATDPFIAELVDLVHRGHVVKILPNLRKALTAPETLQKGFYEQALQEVDYTLDRLVNHPKALMLSQIITNALNRPNLPVKYYERALSLYPQYAITHAQYGNFLTGIGQTEKGIAQLEKAITLDPELPPAYAWLSIAYQKKGNKDLAAQFAQKAKHLGFKGKLPQ